MSGAPFATSSQCSGLKETPARGGRPGVVMLGGSFRREDPPGRVRAGREGGSGARHVALERLERALAVAGQLELRLLLLDAVLLAVAGGHQRPGVALIVHLGSAGAGGSGPGGAVVLAGEGDAVALLLGLGVGRGGRLRGGRGEGGGEGAGGEGAVAVGHGGLLSMRAEADRGRAPSSAAGARHRLRRMRHGRYAAPRRDHAAVIAPRRSRFRAPACGNVRGSEGEGRGVTCFPAGGGVRGEGRRRWTSARTGGGRRC